jgi:hypothetical protein
MSETYYKLPREQRWLKNPDSPTCLGGQNTDLEMLGLYLGERIKQMYPVNQVPLEIALGLAALMQDLRYASTRIQEFIEMVSYDIATH